MRKKLLSNLLTAAALVFCLVSPVSAADHPFRDVSPDQWFSDSVTYVYRENLMNGIEDHLFAPDLSMSRAMLVTVLHRMDGAPASSADLPFRDIRPGDYYITALSWAYEHEIINGLSATEFAPNLPITREMMVTMFHRYAAYKMLDTTTLSDLSAYTDHTRISAYAQTPFRWAVAAGVIRGMTETELSPAAQANRAQCAAILQRFSLWVAQNPHEHTWLDHVVTEQVLVKEGYFEPIYDFVDHGYEDTVIASDGTDLTGKTQAEIDQYLADHPGVTVEVKSEWIVGWEIVDYEWIDPVYETVETVDYQYCAQCGVHK